MNNTLFGFSQVLSPNLYMHHQYKELVKLDNIWFSAPPTNVHVNSSYPIIIMQLRNPHCADYYWFYFPQTRELSMHILRKNWRTMIFCKRDMLIQFHL